MFHIIDDTHFACDVMKEVIESLGYPSLSFYHGEEYVEYVKGPHFKKPIGVFVDIIMPDIDGYSLINSVSDLVPELKFVVMTSEPGIRSEHIDKACMYLGKPLTPHHIIKVVDRLIRCQAFAPDQAHRCDCIDDRDLFPTDRWSCPIELRKTPE